MSITIKAPNADDIFARYLRIAPKKDVEKGYAVKGAVFDLDKISAAESVQNVTKGAVFYYQYKIDIKPVAKSTGDEQQVQVPKADRIDFFDFGSASVDKEKWKKKEDKLPGFKTIRDVSCTKCGGNGYLKCDCGGTGEMKCGKCEGKGTVSDARCKGTGKLEVELTVYDGALNKNRVRKPYQCPECYGAGNLTCPECNGAGKIMCKKCGGKKGLQCKDCGGVGKVYGYAMIPVPYKAVSGLDVGIFPSLKLGKFEKEMGQELEQILEKSDAISIKDVKQLNQKVIEPNLGYIDGPIKNAMNECAKEFSNLEKNKDTKPQYPIWVFPLLILDCKTRKGSSYQIYAIGTEKSFIVRGNL
ncbi:MAG: Uncharacterized protein RBG13Loki_3065 [Promethearchaeota archaeon CR_4]|nr:MAG: Uncharacterized protein RBG13Loki_3065 [Candidatus Lokiarchaeota archaeon CR_4]